MTRLPLALRRTSLPLLLVLAVASGCGGGGGRDDASTNGLEKLSAQEVQYRAAAELKAVKSIHVTGTSTVAGDPVRIDLRFAGTSTSGSLTADGVHVAVTRIGDAFYVKTDRRGLKQLGAATVARVGANRWLKLGPEQITDWEGLSLADIAGQLAGDDNPLEPEVTQTTLALRPVVVLRHRDGSKLYVANTGRPYPLRGEYNGPDAGRIEFSEYGADFEITAPEGALDIPALVAGRR